MGNVSVGVMIVACQLANCETGEELPRIRFDADMHHDAERTYCEKFGINQNDVGPCKSGWRTWYWLESQEIYDEAWDEPA